MSIYAWERQSIAWKSGGACDVMVIVVQNGLSDLNLNPGRDC